MSKSVCVQVERWKLDILIIRYNLMILGMLESPVVDAVVLCAFGWHVW
jgi:hypothetical protein